MNYLNWNNFVANVLGELTSWNKVDREVAREFNLIVRAGDDICGVNSTIDTGMLEIDEFLRF
jgi:hypothetical protein